MHDVIVVGAGAAGIGAGLALTRRKSNFLILEAKDRVGGRAYSESDSLGQVWDQGCHWFHSASINPLRQIALKVGHGFVDRPVPYSTWLWREGSFLEPDGFEEEYETLMARLAAKDVANGDVPISALMDGASPWHALLRHDMALTFSQEAENISVADAKAFHDTGENIPVSGGYGNLLARLARPLPVRLSTPVTAITVSGQNVRVTTGAGNLEAKEVIVAVPQRAIERNLIRFSPRLPAAIEEVFEHVQMGWFEKTGLAFDAPVFGEKGGSGVEILARVAGEAWPVAVQLGSGETPIAICHVAGTRARDLAARERITLCEDVLADCFGSALRKHVTRRASTSWTSDPFIGGAYSCARPGRAHLRQRLTEPVHGRIHFAGEHTSADAMATAHGAYASGVAAAARALKLPPNGSDVLWLPENI